MSISDPHNRHNLSTTGPGLPGVTKDTQQRQICIFCHTPHHATSVTPLWSRDLSEETYIPYVSTTLRATSRPGQPSGASRLCLSCHDGTIALGMLAGERQIATLPQLPAERASNLTSDLSDDHPISFSYASAVTSNSGLRQPQELPVQIQLEDGNLECTSCHDPHRDLYPPPAKPTESGKFLVLDNNASSALCTACHSRAGLTDGAHYLSDDACGKCHAPHKAQQLQRLLKGQTLQDTCLQSCHNGSGPVSTTGSNIQAMLSQPKAHRSSSGLLSGSHDAAENPLDFTSANSHVECVDCHNPCLTRHETTPLSNPPWINGRLIEVTLTRAADGTRTMATREYEICFKCHDSVPFTLAASVTVSRKIPTLDESARFSPDNPSYHPVMAAVRGADVAPVPSLRAEILGTSRQLTVGGMIYCSDCHNPHGAPPPITHLLVAEYQHTSQPYSYSNFELCYRCHREEIIMSPAQSSFPNHKSHVDPDPVVDPLGRHTGKEVPCSACHDPHGVPVTLGGTTTANAHLINFDTNIVSPATPVPVYTATSPGHGSCTVSCHTTGSPDPQTHAY
ncbi:MAG: cytochrome C [Geobacteraceae bacterium]|nr:cytochrome C [Geobacteraceae bacterium]